MGLWKEESVKYRNWAGGKPLHRGTGVSSPRPSPGRGRFESFRCTRFFLLLFLFLTLQNCVSSRRELISRPFGQHDVHLDPAHNQHTPDARESSTATRPRRSAGSQHERGRLGRTQGLAFPFDWWALIDGLDHQRRQ